MADLAEAVQFHVEGCLEDGDTLPEWLVKGDYEFDVELGIAALLRRCEQFTSMAAISRASGISQQQLSHYANGLKNPRPAQRQRIVELQPPAGHSPSARLFFVSFSKTPPQPTFAPDK